MILLTYAFLFFSRTLGWNTPLTAWVWKPSKRMSRTDLAGSSSLHARTLSIATSTSTAGQPATMASITSPCSLRTDEFKMNRIVLSRLGSRKSLASTRAGSGWRRISIWFWPMLLKRSFLKWRDCSPSTNWTIYLTRHCVYRRLLVLLSRRVVWLWQSLRGYVKKKIASSNNLTSSN